MAEDCKQENFAQNQEPSEITPETSNTQEGSQYDKRAELFLADLDKKLEANKIETACLIIYDPELKKPITYIRGNQYSVAVAACTLARFTKRQLMQSGELNV